MSLTFLAIATVSILATIMVCAFVAYRRINKAGYERMIRLIEEIKSNQPAGGDVADWLYIKGRIQTDLPLPKHHSSSANPALLRLLIAIIERDNAEYLVEAGSGLSSVIIGYILKNRGSGQLISLEDNEKYFEITSANVKSHGLEDHVTIVLAPLVKHQVNGSEVNWYSINTDELIDQIDVLFIDGPRRDSGELARYPAVPILHEKLKKGSTIILDDGNRPDEKIAVRKWIREFPDMKFQYFDSGNGCFLGKRC